MSTTSEEQAQIANALNNLAAAMERLQDRYDAAQRANRHARVALFFASLIILGGVGYWALTPVSRMISVLAPQTLARRDPEAAEAERIRLKELLAPEERAHIEEFEAQVKWVHDYLKVFTDFDAGASITLFLAQMSASVKVMPAMYAEVRSMKQEMITINAEMSLMNAKMNSLPAMARDVQGLNIKMDALPILATDVHGMHAQMGVISAGMDSTVGQAGRMMPWNW
jgi:hypothetical protein